MKPPIIFLSYSHEDERDKNRLVVQIKVLEQTGIVDLWNDDRIKVGDNWKSDIDAAMSEASIAILLITANFLTSDFILNVEVPELIKRHKKAGLDIFPVIARDCAWEKVEWLAKMNVRPKNGMPVWRSGGRYAEKELAKIAREVSEIIKREKPDEQLNRNSETIPLTLKGKLNRNIRDAIEAINRSLDNIKRYSEELDAGFFGINEIVFFAIHYGAPLYNQGSIIDCAEIYYYAVSETIKLLDESDFGRVMSLMQDVPVNQTIPESKFEQFMNNRHIAMEIAYGTLKEVSTPALSVNNAMKVAWRIRHGFDQIRFIATALHSIDKIRYSSDKYERISYSAIEKIIKLTITQSDLIYEEGLVRGKNWIKACVAIYLYGAEQMLYIIPMLEIHQDKSSLGRIHKLEMDLKNTIPYKEFVTDKNAYEIAWKIRHALERYWTQL